MSLSPIADRIAQAHTSREAVLLKRLVLNIRTRRAIETDIVNSCTLETAADLFIVAEEIVRAEMSPTEPSRDNI